MKKVLIITYYWPPSGGAGVQRWLKFSKYLPQYGWQPVILTVDPGYAAYPAIDKSLEKEVPEGISVFRTKATDWFRVYSRDKSKVPSAGFARNMDNTFRGRMSRFIRGNFFIPDPRRGWNRYAVKKAVRIIKEEGISHIISTSPPHSSQLIGLKLKKQFPRIKWIADLRDPWTDIYYYNRFCPSLLAKAIDSHYEKKVLEKADIIITVGQSLKKSLALKSPGIESKIRVITNGYDSSDFEGVTVNPPEKLIISYMGTLSGSYPVNGLVAAVKKLTADKKDFILRFAGEIPETTREMIVNEIPGSHVEFFPYLDHDEAIKFILGSAILLLIIPDHSSNKGILTGKLFEYLAAAKPVLCLGPTDGDAATVLEKTGQGKCYSYTDENGIYDFILKSMDESPAVIKAPPVEYSRRKLAGELVSLL